MPNFALCMSIKKCFNGSSVKPTNYRARNGIRSYTPYLIRSLLAYTSVYILACFFPIPTAIPAPPQQLNYSIQEYGQNTFTATVLWENLLDDRVGRTNITIIITDFEPTLLLPDTATAVALTLSYNEVHTVSIAATNCAGTSDASQLKIYEGNYITVAYFGHYML